MVKTSQFVCLIIFAILIVILSVSAPLDGDLWWQMEYGRKILESGNLRSDHTIYSWTKSSNALVYCAWIAQIALYKIYDTLGFLGLNIFRVLVLLTPILLCWLITKNLKVELKTWHWAIAFLAYYASKYAGGMLKPELFGYLCFAFLVFLYLKVKSDINLENRRLEIYFIPLLTLIWVNSHGTFTLAGAFLFIAVVGEGLNLLFSKRICLNPSQWKNIFIIVPITALTIIITPYGYEWPIQIISNAFTPVNEVHFKSVFAYQSIFRDQIAHLNIREVFLVLGVVALVLFIESAFQKRFDFALFALNVFFLVLANGWGRASYFSPILLLFTIVYLSSTSSLITKLAEQRPVIKLALPLLVICVGLFAIKKSEQALLGDQKGHYTYAGFLNPQDSADFYEKNLTGKRICNGYNGGGYLIWRFRGEDKVMIDPRYFPYVDWYSKWVEMKDGKRTDEHVDSLNCEVWILGHHYSKIASYLSNSQDWKIAYIGRAANVFVRANLKGWPERKLELAPNLGETQSIVQTARIINSLLRTNRLDLALQVADQSRGFWKNTLNQGKSNKAYDFLLGSKYFLEKKDLLAHQYLESAHQPPAVITNLTRLRNSRVFATQLLWLEKEYERAYKISLLTLGKEPENPMFLYNTAFLHLYMQDRDSLDWRSYLNKMLATESENKLGIPVKYFDHAREMLKTGEPVNAPTLKFTDKRA